MIFFLFVTATAINLSEIRETLLRNLDILDSREYALESPETRAAIGSILRLRLIEKSVLDEARTLLRDESVEAVVAHLGCHDLQVPLLRMWRDICFGYNLGEYVNTCTHSTQLDGRSYYYLGADVWQHVLETRFTDLVGIASAGTAQDGGVIPTPASQDRLPRLKVKRKRTPNTPTAPAVKQRVDQEWSQKQHSHLTQTAIMQELLSLGGYSRIPAVTTEEIFSRLKPRIPNITLSNILRTLSVVEQFFSVPTWVHTELLSTLRVAPGMSGEALYQHVASLKPDNESSFKNERSLIYALRFWFKYCIKPSAVLTEENVCVQVGPDRFELSQQQKDRFLAEFIHFKIYSVSI